MLAGFHQVLVHPEDRKYLAFTKPDGTRWQFAVWPFGFTASPWALQKAVEALVIDPGILPYVDDVAVTTPPSGTWEQDLEEHLSLLRKFLEQCRLCRITLSLDKAQLLEPHIDFLGHRVTPGKGFTVGSETASTILSMPPPAEKKALRKALGVFGWVSPSIPMYAERVAPLRSLLLAAERADAHHKRGGRRPSSALFPLRGAALRAFNDLKSELASPRVIHPFNPEKESVLVSDASQFGIGAALYQDDKLVGVFSTTVSEARTRWRVYDLEAFAVVRALQHWRTWLKGRPVKVLTDHKALLQLADPAADLPPKAHRWLAELLEFDVNILHVSGESAQMAMSDWLSRRTQAMGDQQRVTAAVLLEARAMSLRHTDPADVQEHHLSSSADVRAIIESPPAPTPHPELPPGFPEALVAVANRALAVRSSNAVKGTLSKRYQVSAWRWQDTSPAAALKARAEWLALADQEVRDTKPANVRFILAADALSPLLEIIKEAPEDPTIEAAKRLEPDSFSQVDGLWWKKEKDRTLLVIPPNEARDTFFQLAHDSRMAGHRDALSTVTRLRQVAWWPRLAADVEKMVEKCSKCCAAKHRTSKPPGVPGAVPIPEAPFAHVHIDEMHLPLSGGYSRLWITVDRLSHWVTFTPGMAGDSSADVARRLWKSTFSVFGIPGAITSDNDSRLTSQFANTL